MESSWNIPAEVRFEIYKRCRVSHLITLSCCNSAFNIELTPLIWRTVRIPMQVLSNKDLLSSVKLDNLQHTRTLRFDYRKWFAFDTMNLKINYENLLHHCNPLLLRELEDAHEEILTHACKSLNNLHFLSFKCSLEKKLVNSLCSLRNLIELHLTEKPSSSDFSKICSSLVQLKSLKVENVTQQDLGSLQKLVCLETLNVPWSKFCSEGLSYICTLKQLKNLYLKGCINITDDGVPSLLLLTSLRRLDMSGCRMTDRCVPHLTRIPSLLHLTLQETCITDDALKQISSKMKSLRKLNIAACNFVTNVGITYLSKLIYLEELNVGHTYFSDEGVKGLQCLVRLRTLDISNTKITDHGLTHVSKMERVCELVCAWNSVTDAGIRHLFVLNSLRKLNVIGCKNVTNEVLSTLYLMTSVEEINVSGNKITDFYRKLLAF